MKTLSLFAALSLSLVLALLPFGLIALNDAAAVSPIALGAGR